MGKPGTKTGSFTIRHGAGGPAYENQSLNRAHIDGIKFQKGCALDIIMDGRGDEATRKRMLGWVEGNYPSFILVRIDTPRGPYRMSLNKVDIAMRKGLIVKEVV